MNLVANRRQTIAKQTLNQAMNNNNMTAMYSVSDCKRIAKAAMTILMYKNVINEDNALNALMQAVNELNG